jgi:5,10-methylenetetrahydromethanopterin reductase
VRHLLRRSREPYAGKVFSLAGGDSLRWEVSRPELPFLLGTWGSTTIRTCIGQVSEVKVGGTASARAVARIRDEVTTAARAAGRDPREVGVAVGAVTVVDRDGAAARALARRKVALYVPVIARLDATLPVEPDRLRRIDEAAAEYDFERAAREITDDLLRRLAFAGTADEVAAQAEALFAAGAGRVEFGTPHGLSEEEGIRLLGEAVLPALGAGSRRG